LVARLYEELIEISTAHEFVELDPPVLARAGRRQITGIPAFRLHIPLALGPAQPLWQSRTGIGGIDPANFLFFCGRRICGGSASRFGGARRYFGSK
jgi:hypothetical protein